MTLSPRGALREWLFGTVAFVALGLGLLWLAYAWLDPQPPRRVVLATGVERGAYDRFGQRYAALLKAHGITVELRPTAGAAENLALLRQPDSGVDLAFALGGTAANEGAGAAADAPEAGLVSLGNLAYEPVWLFYREEAARRHLKRPVLDSLAQLTGWTVNVGEPGSGVPPLVARLLEANSIAPAALSLHGEPLTPAVVALLEGRLDALVIVSAPEAAMVQMLLQTPGIRLLDVAQAEAYARRLPFLSAVLLPRGVVDLARDLPPQDVRLVAPTATLLARPTLHPALAQLFVQAAQQVHGAPGWFQHKGEFPNAGDAERPLADEAARFYRQGVPWLQRYLPFWLANLADRMWVALLAIVAVLLPLSRVLPPLVEWRVRSRVFRWYGRLRSLEAEARRAGADRPALLAALDEIEQAASQVRLPLSHADALYALKAHIQLVRQRLSGPG
jgi:TRAP-type uncharacterized transport system substrate-binding protein